MNVLRGIALKTVAVATPVICVAAIALWIVSYRVGIGVNWSFNPSPSRTRFETIRSYQGQLSYAMEDHGYTFLIGPPHHGGLVQFEPSSDYRSKTYGLYTKTEGVQEFAGFGFRNWDRFVRALILPYWSIVLVSGFPVARKLIRRSREAWQAMTRRRLGHCRVCGYDLRATPQRCPECGTASKAADTVGEGPVAGN